MRDYEEGFQEIYGIRIEEAMNFLKKYDNTSVVKELGEDLERMMLSRDTFAPCCW